VEIFDNEAKHVSVIAVPDRLSRQHSLCETTQDLSWNQRPLCLAMVALDQRAIYRQPCIDAGDQQISNFPDDFPSIKVGSIP
jgi:hypothetical protein